MRFFFSTPGILVRRVCSTLALKSERNRFLTPAVIEETLNEKFVVTSEPNIGIEVVESLERLSLVNFANEEGLLKLKETIKFASVLTQVDTTGVEPLVTVLEDRPLKVREDKVEVYSRQEILSCATVTDENYFVAPPGNIPLEPKQKEFWKVVQKA